MFRRTKSPEQPAQPTPAPGESPARSGGKGRPTPTRREAEAAARARARKPRSRREQMAAQRQVRGESSQRIRQGIKEGDPKYLPARDQGPVRHFIRDYVDVRFSIMEVMVPLLLVTLFLGWSGNPTLMSMSSVMTLAAMVMIAMDMVALRFRLRRELARRFPEASPRGTTWYAVMRALQMRFMRLPKPQVRIGQELPDTYR